MHVNNVLNGQVADVEGQAVFAEPLEQLDVVQRVRHGGRVPEGDGAPVQVLGTVQ